jgi:hypothetical protein
MKFRHLFFVPILLFLWSCGESSLFMAEEEEDAQVVLNLQLADGLVAPGARVGIELERDPLFQGNEESADSVRVELFSFDGELLATQRYDSVDQANSLPGIALPELEDGLYKLTATYLDGTEVVTSVTEPFFMVSGRYRVLGVSSYPASSFPGADSLLSLSLDVPQDSDPYLVWKIAGEVVVHGYLSRTRQTLAVAAPGAQGIFPVQVDLYPVWHPDADYTKIDAPISYRSEIFVSDTPTALPLDFASPENYFMLYHFRGRFQESGHRSSFFPGAEYDGNEFGAPMLAARDNVFGYYLDGRSGVEIPGFVWPVYRGELSPFSISFLLLADPSDDERVLVRSESVDGALLEVLMSEDARIGLRLPEQESVLWSDVPAMLAGEPVELIVSVIPHEDQTIVHFYSDSVRMGTSSAALPNGIASQAVSSVVNPEWGEIAGSTTVGARSGGFAGIIDEFGIYFRNDRGLPRSDDSVFVDAVVDRFGDDVVHAESFANGFVRSRSEIVGEASWRDAALELSVGSELRLPPLELGPGSYRLELGGEGNASLWLVLGSQERLFVPFEQGEAVAEIVVTESELRFVIAGNETDIARAVDQSGNDIRFSFEIAGDEDDTFVLSEVVVGRVSETE